jgi:radical SAM superfamily enzyme YgiQ (UPF0313 family)
MRILFVQLTAPGMPPGAVQYSAALGTLAAAVAKAGHTADLAGMGDFDEEFLRTRIHRARPDIVALWYRSVHTTPARRTAAHVRGRHQLPVVVAGPHATVEPADALSLPGVVGVAYGEAERPLVEFLNAYSTGDDHTAVRGMWFNTEAGVRRNEPPPLTADLDLLPWPDRRLFGYAEIVRRTGVAEFSVGRGCPSACGYCINQAAAKHYEGKGPWVRRRSVDNLLSEVRHVLDTCPGVKRLSFPDCTFAAEPAWLERFASAFRTEFGLPFSCHVRANRCDDRIAGLLKAAGCDEAHVEVVSGSDFIRNDVFGMELSSAQVAGAVVALRRAGLGVVTRNLVGSPYESDITIEETARLNRELRPDASLALTFHPFPGTASAALVREMGWMSGRREEDFFAGLSLLDLRSLKPDEIRRRTRKLPGEIAGKPSSPTGDTVGTGATTALLPDQNGEAGGGGAGRGPIHYREDGTTFAASDLPVHLPDAAAFAGQPASAWETVRSGVLCNAIALPTAAAGVLVASLGVVLSRPEAELPPAVPWGAVVAGFYAVLFAAVVWVCGNAQCMTAPPRVRASGFALGSLMMSVAAVAVAWLGRSAMDSTDAAPDAADSEAAAWHPAAVFAWATALHWLWSGGQAMLAVALRRVSAAFSADSGATGPGVYRVWQRFNVAAAVAGAASGPAAYLMSREDGGGWGWGLPLTVSGLAAAAAAAYCVRVSLGVYRLLGLLETGGDEPSPADAPPAPPALAAAPAGARADFPTDPAVPAHANTANTGEPARPAPAPRCSICGTILPRPLPGLDGTSVPRCPLCDSGKSPVVRSPAVDPARGLPATATVTATVSPSKAEPPSEPDRPRP